MGEMFETVGAGIAFVVDLVFDLVWMMIGSEQNLKKIVTSVSEKISNNVLLASIGLSALISFLIVFIKGLKTMRGETLEYLSVAFELGLGTITALILAEILLLETASIMPGLSQNDDITTRIIFTPVLIAVFIGFMIKISVGLRRRGYFPRYHPDQSFPERYDRELRPIRGMIIPNFQAYFMLTATLLWFVSDIKLGG